MSQDSVPLDSRTVAKIAAGFAVAASMLYFLGTQIGWDEIRAVLSGANVGWLLVACGSTALGLAAWGRAWQIVLRVVGVTVPYRKLVVTYFAATFANYVTPLGQAGGEPFIAYVLARDTEASYEDSLASVVTADLLNLLPFFNFAAVGLGVLLFQSRLSADIENLAVGLLALAVGVPLVVVVGWRQRDAVEWLVLRLVWPATVLTDRISLPNVRDRIRDFYGSLDLIAANPRALWHALAYSYTGWVFFALPLYFAARTLEISFEPFLIFFIVPASTLAGLVPTPGGLGAVEGALTGLLVAIADATTSQAFAMASVYRVASYWFAIVLGGLAALWVLKRV
jgi:uncharacterized protein (TIRG00374 family)